MTVAGTSAATDQAADRFRILVICTANICRSPFAERLLAGRLAEVLGPAAKRIEVTSAGVRALIGRPIDPPSGALLKARGGSAEGFASRQLTERLLREADLVLTMTREHRAAAVQLAPAALRRTFTLPEFARIARAAGAGNGRASTGDPVEALRRLVAAAPVLRSPTAPRDPREDDVDDPYRLAEEAYRSAAERMADAVEAIVEAVR